MRVCASVFKSLRRGRLPCRPGSESQRRGSCEGGSCVDGSRHTALEASTIKNTCLLLSFSPLGGLRNLNKRRNISSKVKQTDRRTKFTRRRTISIHEEAMFLMTPCDSVKLETEPSWSEGREVMTRAEISAPNQTEIRLLNEPLWEPVISHKCRKSNRLRLRVLKMLFVCSSVQLKVPHQRRPTR